jgi:hypothetical protein
MPRRSNFDPLDPTKEARWYSVRTMHGALLDARELAAGCELTRTFVGAMLEWIDAALIAQCVNERNSNKYVIPNAGPG